MKSTPSYASARLLLIGIFDYPVEFVLIIVTIVTSLYAYYYHNTWSDIIEAFVEKIQNAVTAMLILFLIGMLIGCWMVSGTIPLMVYYGLEIINPSYLYLTAFLVTVCVSTFTGTS